MANHNPEATKCSPLASYMLPPRFLRLPDPFTFPIGLVMKPSALTGSLFHELIAYCSNVDGHLLKWLDNAILDTWFEAVAANPSLFQVDAIPHSCFAAFSPTAGNPKLLAIHLHQEWVLLSQLLLDQAFAMLSKQNLAMLTCYAESLVTTYNSGESNDNINNTWGVSLLLRFSAIHTSRVFALCPTKRKPPLKCNSLCSPRSPTWIRHPSFSPLLLSPLMSPSSPHGHPSPAHLSLPKPTSPPLLRMTHNLTIYQRKAVNPLLPGVIVTNPQNPLCLRVSSQPPSQTQVHSRHPRFSYGSSANPGLPVVLLPGTSSTHVLLSCGSI
jgi:hypothetical protein